MSVLVDLRAGFMKQIWDQGLTKYLNTVNPEESDVVAAVQSEANNVQREEIKVETNYAENKGRVKARASYLFYL